MENAKALKADQCRVYHIGQEKMTFRLTAQETQGKLSVIERVVAANFQSPPQFHAHADTDWSCLVLEGQLKFHFQNESVLLHAHETVFVPRETFFRWENPSNTPALALFTYTPAGFEEFFAEMATFLNSTTKRIDHYEETLQFILKTQDKYKMYRKG